MVSVTAVISFVNSRAFEGIPPEVLARAASRGTQIHTQIALELLGLWFEEDPETAGYMQSCRDWHQKYVQEVIWVEKELVHSTLGFCGHPDALLLLKGDKTPTLVDWKSPVALSKSWRLQVGGGYTLLARANGWQVGRVASVRLDKAGGPAKFQGYSKTLAQDMNTFLAALNVYKFFNED